MRKLILWTSILSAAAAAYLMFKRGVPAREIVENIAEHPVGTLVHELTGSSQSA